MKQHKIPENAKQVFNGIIFDVYQWEQKQFDGSTKTFEMLKRPNTIQVIATSGEKVFVGKEQQPDNPNPFYSLFGGRQEKGEEPLTTAKRELLEETGLSSQDWELLKVDFPQVKVDWSIYLFIARNCKKVQQQQLDSGEKIEVLEVSFEKFLDIIESKEFWGTQIRNDIFRIRQNSKDLADFKKKLFG